MKTVNLNLGDRVTLFSSLAIETASLCNRKCFFCPVAYNTRPDVYMPLDLIDKMLEELKTLNYRGRLEWYIYNEPTRDKRLPELILRARRALPYICQMINTNGDYFKSAEDIQKLFDAGLNQMQINIYSARDGNPDLVKIESGVKLASFREAKIGLWVNSLGISQTESLYQNIGHNKRAIKVVGKYGISGETKDSDLEGPNHFSNRSGNVTPFRSALTKPLDKMCTRPFRFLNVNYDGEALLCCNDYHGVLPIGNVKDETLEDLWNSEVLNKYRIKLQNKKRNAVLCDVCDFKGGPYQHMIDHVTTGSQASDDKIIEEYL